MGDLQVQTQGAPRVVYTMRKSRWETVRTVAKNMVQDKLALIAFLFFALIVIAAILAPVLSPYDYTVPDVRARLKPPMWAEGGVPEHIFGTDQQGRDVLSRILWGGRVSMRVGFFVVIVAGTIGTALGMIAGLTGGKIDSLIMRAVDIMFCLPGLLVALIFVMILGPGERNLIIALTINGWMVFTRLSRGLVVAMRDGPLVEAARAVGVPQARILIRHVLPNISAPILTLFVLEVARIMLAEAGMSFLGYGIQPPASSWGLIIGQGRDYITNDPWLVTLPGIFLALTVLSLNVLANWFRTEADPLQKARGSNG